MVPGTQTRVSMALAEDTGGAAVVPPPAAPPSPKGL